MPEPKRGLVRPLEELSRIEDFKKGTVLSPQPNLPVLRISHNLIPQADGSLALMRGQTYHGSAQTGASSSEMSWMRDLHNEKVVINRPTSNDFIVFDGAASPTFTSYNTDTYYGASAIDEPVSGRRNQMAEMGAWTIHAKPFIGWYEGIRTGIRSPLLLGSSSIDDKSLPVVKHLPMRESSLFTADDYPRQMPVGTPVPLASGQHEERDHGTAFATSSLFDWVNASGQDRDNGYTPSLSGNRAFSIAADNRKSDGLGFAPLLHAFHLSGANSVQHSIHMQDSGDCLYYQNSLVSSDCANGIAPLASDVDSAGNCWMAHVTTAAGGRTIRVTKIAPPGVHYTNSNSPTPTYTTDTKAISPGLVDADGISNICVKCDHNTQKVYIGFIADGNVAYISGGKRFIGMWVFAESDAPTAIPGFGAFGAANGSGGFVDISSFSMETLGGSGTNDTKRMLLVANGNMNGRSGNHYYVYYSGWDSASSLPGGGAVINMNVLEFHPPTETFAHEVQEEYNIMLGVQMYGTTAADICVSLIVGDADELYHMTIWVREFAVDLKNAFELKDFRSQWDTTNLFEQIHAESNSDLSVCHFGTSANNLFVKSTRFFRWVTAYSGEKVLKPLKFDVDSGAFSTFDVDSTTIAQDIGCGMSPITRVQQTHLGTACPSGSYPQVLYVKGFNGSPILVYSRHDGSVYDTMIHPLIYGGIPVADEGPLPYGKKHLHQGANFHPMTPYNKDENTIDWNTKLPLMLGQDVNVVSRVTTEIGDIDPGKYRYKFSFAKAGSEDTAVHSTGAEGNIFHDSEFDSFLEMDMSNASGKRGVRLYFNLPLLNARGTSSLSTGELFVSWGSTGSTVELLRVWNGSHASSMNWNRGWAPAAWFDRWHTRDMLTDPQGGTTAPSLNCRESNSSSPFVIRIATAASETALEADSSPSLGTGDSVVRHGAKSSMEGTYGNGIDAGDGTEKPLIKKLIIWRTGDVSNTATDPEAYFKVGEFDFTGEYGNEYDFSFLDRFATAQLSSETGPQVSNSLPPTQNITAIGSGLGKLWIAAAPIAESSRTKVSTIYYSGTHWEYFPGTNLFSIGKSAVVRHFEEYRGSMLIFTDQGIWSLTLSGEQAAAFKVSDVILHHTDQDGARVLNIDGLLWILGNDGLYAYDGSKMQNAGEAIERFFKDSRTTSLGLYWDESNKSICVYVRDAGITSPIFFLSANNAPMYIRTYCFNLITQGWWSTTLTRAIDFIEISANNSGSSEFQYPPSAPLLGLEHNGSTSERVILMNNEWRTPLGLAQDGWFETPLIGTQLEERKWIRVNVEIIPSTRTSSDASLSPVMAIIADTYDSGVLTLGSAANKSFSEVTVGSSTEVLSPVGTEIKTWVASDLQATESEFMRIRGYFKWFHTTSGLHSKLEPRIKGIQIHSIYRKYNKVI